MRRRGVLVLSAGVLVVLVLAGGCSLAARAYSYHQGPVSKAFYKSQGPFPCPGLYCGRSEVDNETYSACGRCDRGWRVGNNTHSLCRKCTESPSKNDWFFLASHLMLVLVLHWLAIDHSANHRRTHFTREVLLLHLSALLEVAGAALVAVLVSEPFGRLAVTSCQVRRMQDWYTFFQNPNPNYSQVLHCSQEAVYPLYTMLFVFYALCTLFMLILRPLLSPRLLLVARRGRRKAIYAALYFLPVLALIHAVGGGLVYASYHYIILVLSIVSSAFHFAFKLDQSPRPLMMGCFRGSRSAAILLGHWLMHAFGIMAITQLERPIRDLSLLSLVPVPALFYIATSRFSDPENFANDMNS